jgi:hypothetical protein
MNPSADRIATILGDQILTLAPWLPETLRLDLCGGRMG